MKRRGGFIVLAVCAVLLFGYEMLAIAIGGQTISAAIWQIEQAWPFFSALVCLIIGGLLVHFFWHSTKDRGF